MIICSQVPIIFFNVVELSTRNHPGVKKKVNSKVNSKEENHEKKVPPPKKKTNKIRYHICIEHFRIEDLVSVHKTHKLHVACKVSI